LSPFELLLPAVAGGGAVEKMTLAQMMNAAKLGDVHTVRAALGRAEEDTTPSMYSFTR
jgi:hypothetical protein